jgi:hypothetical protein
LGYKAWDVHCNEPVIVIETCAKKIVEVIQQVISTNSIIDHQVYYSIRNQF